jgi:hypothetical protein
MFAFVSCDSLTSIKVSSDNPSFIDIDGVLYNKDKTRLICVPQGKDVKQYTIPDSVTCIGGGAFFGCSSLNSIDIPNSVTRIEYYAFCDCSSLTSIVIPNSVTSIGNDAFRGCSSLTSIDISNSVTSILEDAFWGCSSLTSVDIPDSVTSIGKKAFGGCSSLTAIYFRLKSPDSIEFETNIFGEIAFPENLFDTCTLYVPAGTRWAYRHHPVLGKFKNIEIEH